MDLIKWIESQGYKVTSLGAQPPIFERYKPINNKINNGIVTPLNHKEMVKALLDNAKKNNVKCPVCNKENCPIFLRDLMVLNKSKTDSDVLRNMLLKHSQNKSDEITKSNEIKSQFNKIEQDISEQLGKLGIPYSKEVQSQAFINYYNAMHYLDISKTNNPTRYKDVYRGYSPLYGYTKDEIARIAIWGFNDIGQRISAGANYATVISIKEMIMPYVLAEGVGGTASGGVYGYFSLKNNVFSANLGINSSNKEVLNNSSFHPSTVSIYSNDGHLILKKGIRQYQNVVHHPNERNIGGIEAVIPEHYRGTKLTIVANLAFQYNSGSGIVPAGEFTDVKKEVLFK
ncbi:hypothetical protein A6B43_00300 [Vespertiliibacter pulmonis]|uniref:Uncharacterized protein n=1 Tax=Vespertiliibacter pulmonis TaxID=1443036 RepID=A0A3N4VSH0_9PAST|nr:hypothetical protein [Vespertiliibacter pulmonis]QLB20087.1 hypothetical protein A6B43_00300 [Vespertiliibacter pulmonis]RPE86052.1 hypothetical protein EDC46_0443 [Vespertiliibacter pulmonis]